MANPIAITLHASGAEGSDGVGAAVDVTLDSDGVSTYPRSAAKLLLAVTAVSGTGPTLDVVVETSASGTGGWQQIGAFSTAAAEGHQRLAVAGAERYVRARWAIAGDDAPSFTFALSGDAVTCYAIPEDMHALGLPAEALEGVADDVIARQLIANTDLVAGYINASHEAPLTAWGDDIRRAVAILTARDGLQVIGSRPDEFDEGFRLAVHEMVGDPSTSRMGWLELVAAGKLTPVGIVDATPDTYEGGGFVESEAPRGWGDL